MIIYVASGGPEGTVIGILGLLVSLRLPVNLAVRYSPIKIDPDIASPVTVPEKVKVILSPGR